MPFKSEDQRRYLWANEPEIARDWTDTYGSRIQNNTGGISRLGFADSNKEYLDFKKWFDSQQKQGQDESIHDMYQQYEKHKKQKRFQHMAATGGIMRLGYADGPITDDMGNTFADTQYKDLTEVQFDEKFGGMDYQVTDEKEGTEKGGILDYISNLSPVKAAMNLGKKMFAPQDLTQAQRDMNNQFLTSQGIGFMPNNPYQMVGGPFHGMNAPGTSAFGSATSQDMAQKWVKKYGDIEREKNSPMARKSQAMKNMATMNQAPPGKDMGMSQSNKGSYSHADDVGSSFNKGGVAGLWRR